MNVISRTCLSIVAAVFVLSLAGTAMADDIKDCKVGAALEVEWNGTWYPAKIIEGPNDKADCKIHYDGYADSWDEWVGAARMRSPNQVCVKGDKTLVKWKGSWYEAEIIDGPKDTDQCKIHYKGYEASWDEYVGPDRMARKSGAGNGRCTKDAKIMVNWKGTWYLASIIEGANDKGECKIHYDGFEASWDEWVNADRIW